MKLAVRLLSLSLIALTCLTGCSKSNKGSVGSSEVTSQERAVTSFNQLIFNGNGNLFLSQGNEESVRIEGDPALVDLITAYVVDSALRIDTKKGQAAQLIYSHAPVNIYVQVTNIQEIRLSGSGTISTVAPIESHHLKISLSGTGSGKLSIQARKLVTILSGSSDFIINGTVGSQDIWISGSGVYQAEGLASLTANVNIKGSGNVSLRVQDVLDINISGSGQVLYLGTPLIRQTITGSATVLRKDG